MTLGEYAALTAAELRRTHEASRTGALFKVTNRHLSQCGIQNGDRKWFWEEVARNWRLQTELETDPPQGTQLERELEELTAHGARMTVSAGSDWSTSSSGAHSDTR